MSADYGNADWFFRRRVSRYEVQEHLIAGALWRLWRPGRVYDLGCGIASYLAAFDALGATVEGCDIGWDAARKYARKSVRANCGRADAAQPLRVGKGFDLVLCLDVAEHIPAAGHPVFFDNLRRLARGPVFFAAGFPGQPGFGHVSCMTRDRWIERAAKYGLLWQRYETQDAVAALDSVGDPLKFRDRVLVFRREVASA